MLLCHWRRLEGLFTMNIDIYRKVGSIVEILDGVNDRRLGSVDEEILGTG